MALTHTPPPKIGTPCPEFTLPGVDGKTYSQQDFLKGTPFLVMFICNHCPYVKAIEDRLIELGHDFRKLGIGCVAISANDAQHYPEDSFVEMKKRSQEKSYSFPYLYDESQAVAQAFGAVCTPDFFLFDADGNLASRSQLDNSWKDAGKVTERSLYLTALDVLNKRPIHIPQLPSMGCSIKWKKA